MNLFASEETHGIQLPLADADVIYYPALFSSEESEKYFQKLFQETQWQQDSITIFGKTHLQPRLTALYGEAGKSYSYSGITMFPSEFTPLLRAIKNRTESISETKFSTVLLNLYRDGNDSNGWHSDDEKELGLNPIIASVSFGAERIFHFRYKRDKTQTHKLMLESGSLLLMRGETQHTWQHQLPKSKKIRTPRINLTFRRIE